MLKLIPKPQKIEEFDGVFKLLDIVNVAGEVSSNIKLQLENVLLPAVGTRIEIQPEYTKDSIFLIVDDGIVDEGYHLIIKEDGITIKSKDDRGFFYAIVTLNQMLHQFGRELPVVNIEDYPRFSYRGFMLDVGRYFFPVKDVKTFIDLCAMLKINVLHLHLTEDQGWRIQIDKYPLLTEQGSKRSHTNFNTKPHGGFFTKEDIKYIVEYAHTKYIKVIPEIDMPGHMVSAIACYKYLSCFDRKLEVATHFGVKHDILCAGKESTYEFVKDVLTEVIEMFPDGYIHLGGDEAVKFRWNLCPNCKKKMAELGVNADELQSIFMNEIAEFVKQNGYKAIIWNETEKDKYLANDVIWDYYMYGDSVSKDNPTKPTLEQLFVDELNAGRPCINVQSNAYYYDLPYHDIPLKQAYTHEPMPKGVAKENEANMLGVECDLWTEYVPNMKVAVRKLFPRMFAMVEASWMSADRRDYNEFVERIEVANSMVYDITGYKCTTVKDANPNKAKAFFEKIWFEKRQLHWQGLHNLIDDAKVKNYAKKIK